MNKINYTISKLVNILIMIEGILKGSRDSILKNLESKKGDTPLEGVSNMLVIEFNLTIFSTSSGVWDFGSSAYIYTIM